MPTNQLTTASPTERTRRIIELAKEALDGANFVRKRIYASKEAALECGRLLQKERDYIRDSLGHGAWLPYYEAQFAKLLPLRTACHWMKLAKTVSLATIAPRSQPNELREAVLTLGLFPPKIHPTDPSHIPTPSRNGSAPANAPTPLPKHSTHLGLINRFSAWAAWLKQETNGQLEPEQALQLLKDFEPVEQFIESLRTVIEEANRT